MQIKIPIELPENWADIVVQKLLEKGDYVEVVRCMYCKFWKKQKDSAQGLCVLSSNYPAGGWYCANGERRTDNE